MNGKVFILFVLALGVGGSAAVYAQRWVQQQSSVAAAPDVETVDVITAAKEIPYGVVIEENHLRVVAWPKGSAPSDTFSAKDELVGQIVNQKVVAGEPLLAARVTERKEGSRLASLISPNKRAITVRVNDVAGVAGFLLPGNRVDILATRIVNARAKTETLLQNVKVLAIDQKANPDKDDPVVVRAVTLEADLDEASKLAGATQEGTIQLVLRNPDDIATVVESPPVVLATPKPRARPKDNRLNIEIIRGTQVGQTKAKL